MWKEVLVVKADKRGLDMLQECMVHQERSSVGNAQRTAD